MDTRLRNLLHDLASEMPVEVERSARPTLRRARRRRAMGAAGAVVAVVAFVAVGVSALRMVSEPTVPATTGPNPATFTGLWPETSLEALETAQEAADGGHQPLRVTPEGTASMLATNLLGWLADDVQIERRAADADEATIVISNRILGDDVPPITVELRRLGDTDPNGIWSVVGASTPLIEVEDVTLMMLTDPVARQLGPGSLRVSGLVTDLFEGGTFLEAAILAGPDLHDAVGGASLKLGSNDDVSASGRRFTFKAYVARTPTGKATLLLRLPDGKGASLGAVMLPVETPVGEAPTSGPNVTDLPPDVAVTAQRIYDAAKAKDFDALAELLDANTFISDLGDASDPIPSWRADPSVLDLMVRILEMPPTTRDIGPGYGTFTFWPYLVNSDFQNLTPQERADLAVLGYTDEDIQAIADSELGYQGPRLAIDEDGEWRNFLTVGE